MEQWTHKPLVLGSNPSLAIFYLKVSFLVDTLINGSMTSENILRKTLTFFAGVVIITHP